MNNVGESVLGMNGFFEGGRVILFSDLGGEQKWRDKVSKIPVLRSCVVSSILHRHSSVEERE